MSAAAGSLRVLLQSLSDGRFQSGTAIAKQLDVTRASVWKQVCALRELGVEVEAVQGRGYRLPNPVELLDGVAIARALEEASDAVPNVEVQLSSPSTNATLLERARAGEGVQALLAEVQTAGRGRWGRQWQSPFGSGLYLSLLWRFPVVPGGLSGLSLACAVAVVDVLRQAGAVRVGLKWPNDIVSPAGKLGGILIELVGEPTGPCAVVIGLGLNIELSPAQRAAVDQQVADVSQFIGGAARQRNTLAARLLSALLGVCAEFPRAGLDPYRERWNRYDLLAGRQVSLHLPTGTIDGTAAGIDARGAFCLQTGVGSESFFSGDVQLKVRYDASG